VVVLAVAVVACLVEVPARVAGIAAAVVAAVTSFRRIVALALVLAVPSWQPGVEQRIRKDEVAVVVPVVVVSADADADAEPVPSWQPGVGQTTPGSEVVAVAVAVAVVVAVAVEGVAAVTSCFLPYSVAAESFLLIAEIAA